MTAGAFFAEVFCYVSTLTEGTIACKPGDRLPDDADAAQIARLLNAGAIRFQSNEETIDEAPADITSTAETQAPRKRSARKPKAEVEAS